jgi:hypothetical protein
MILLHDSWGVTYDVDDFVSNFRLHDSCVTLSFVSKTHHRKFISFYFSKCKDMSC